jgi:fido (protein-threonine AMPylation protein)
MDALRHTLSPGQEIQFSNTENRAKIHREVRRGLLRQIGPKIYTSNLQEDPARIVRRNVWQIAAELFPGALVSDRTAIENRPATDNSVFLISTRTRDLELPGVTFRPRKGIPPMEGIDLPFIGGLWMSSPARAYLENLRPSRRRNHVPTTLSRVEIENHLNRVLQTGGEAALNRLRDQCRDLAPRLEAAHEFETLNNIIGALLMTRDADLVSPVAKARAQGLGYDVDRLELFENLRAILTGRSYVDRTGAGNAHFLPFFEAYFSNFIEGTEFLVEEAYEIVYEGVIPKERPADAHDVLGTFRIVSPGTGQSLANATEFIQVLKEWHAKILEGRPDQRPGEFKLRPNRSGDSLFVQPELVEGTLRHGFELFQTLREPFARAVFGLFLVSEVHPFSDGNGRVARVMMNSELALQSQQRVIIPTVFRTEYIQSLKTLTHNQNPDPLIRVIDFAQRYTAEIDWSEYSRARNLLQETHAFDKPSDAIGNSEKLILPSKLVARA